MRWIIALMMGTALLFLVYQNYNVRNALVAMEAHVSETDRENQRLRHIVKAYEQRCGAIHLPGFTADGAPPRPTPRPTRRFQRAPGL